MVYSIKEMIDHTEGQRKEIERSMDKNGFFDPSQADIYDGQKRSVDRELRESIRKIPLREFLVKSGTTGLAGGAYLVPTKIHDILYYSSKQFDVVPLIGQVLTGWEGGALTVDIVKDDSLRAREYGSGGALPTDTADTVKAVITPRAFGFNVPINNEMLEDSQFDLIEWHIGQSGKAMGRTASDLAISVLKTATDGDGTVNSASTGDADETMFTQGTTSDIVTAIRKLGDDEWVPDTLLCTSEAWGHSIMMHAASANMNQMNVAPGYQGRVGMLDVLVNNSTLLHDSTDVVGAAFTACVNIIFSRNNSMLTGRKRWLRVENYAKPFDDLSGVTVTGRQDSVDLYSDSIYILSET